MSSSYKESEIAEGLKVDDLLEFFNAKGHNMMIFADLDVRRHTRRLATNFGVDMENYVSTFIYDAAKISLLLTSCLLILIAFLRQRRYTARSGQLAP